MIPAVVEISPRRGMFRCGFRTDSKNVLMHNTSGSVPPDAIFVWLQYSIRKKAPQEKIPRGAALHPGRDSAGMPGVLNPYRHPQRCS